MSQQDNDSGPARQVEITSAPTGERPDANRRIVLVTAAAVSVLAVCLSLFQLYTAGLTALTAHLQRAVHLGAILSLTWLLHPPFKGARKDKLTIWLIIDIGLIAVTIFVCGYVAWILDVIEDHMGAWTRLDVVVGVIGVLLVLEGCRRVIGSVMTGICAVMLLYAYFGRSMPEMIIHKGYSIERIASTMWFTTEGVFGIPLGVAATFVFVFVLFGAFLEVTGGGQFFIDLAYALTGRFSGGPAKTAVIASGFMGSVSGSAVGNVVATGSFTIPMMKKVGYRPHVAGAIEAAASTGGQLMPPIMGAGAFLMAEYTNTSYLTIIKVALVPAILYYMTVLLFVHFEAQKRGLMGQPKEKLPKALKVIKDGLHFIVPVGILIYVLMANYSPMMAGFVAVLSTVAASLVANFIKTVYGNQRLGPGSAQRTPLARFFKNEGADILRALEKGARNAIMVSVACAAAGVIVGIVSLTGMGLKFSSLVLGLTQIKVFVILLVGAASLILGMGLPVTASYIVLASLAGPALLDLGVPLMVTHMVVFWYSQDANVTPPVSLAAFAGAGVAGANPMQTAFTSWKLAKGLYIIPIVMAYEPMLGMGKGYSLMHWPVILSWISTAGGLIAFAATLERFLLRRATWLETAMLAASAGFMFWPAWWGDLAGMPLLAAVFLLHKYYTPDHLKPAGAAQTA